MASNQDHLLNNEDFEKLDHDPDQVENITSTSLSGDMAEADRYADPNDLLAEFGGGSDEFNLGHAVSTSNNEPLISFESAHPDPIPETEVKEVEQAGPSDGCVFKNVDPRDDVVSYPAAESGSHAAYGDPGLPNIAESPGDCDTAHSFCGDKVPHARANEHRHHSDSSAENSTDSDDDSSSGEESSSESVNTDSSEHAESSEDQLNETVIETRKALDTERNKPEPQLDLAGNNEFYADKTPILDMNNQSVVGIGDGGDVQKYVRQTGDEESEIMNSINNEMFDTTENYKVVEQERDIAVEDSSEPTMDSSDFDKDSVSHLDNVGTNVKLEDEAKITFESLESHKPEDSADSLSSHEHEQQRKDEVPVITLGDSNNDVKSEDREVPEVEEITESPASIHETVSTVVSHEMELSKPSSSASSRESSQGGSIESGEESDIDPSAHEICIGEWNDSPLLAGNHIVDKIYEDKEPDPIDDSEQLSTKSNNEIEPLTIVMEHEMCENLNLKYDSMYQESDAAKPTRSVSNDAVFESILEATEKWTGNNDVDNKETEMNELQEDVKGFINEIDSLAREDEHVDEDDEMLVIGDSSKVESVMKRSNQATCLANKINIGTEILALSNRPHEGEHKLDKELLHVTFQEPYSTIYYDPESPVVERDVVEIMEYDDEAKDIEGEKEKESIDNEDPFRNIDSDSDSIDEESDSSGEFSYSPPVAESLYPTKGTTSTMDTCVSGPTWDTDMNNLNNDKNEQSLEGNGIELINVNVLKDIVDTENNANADNYSLVTEQESAVTELKVENLKPESDSRFEAVEELGMPVDQLADLQPENKHGDADEGIEEKEISVEHKDVENIGINDKRDSKPIEITDDHTLNDDEPLLTLRRSDSDSERESVDSMIIHDVDNLSTTDNNDSSEFETHLENEESNETQDSNAISALIVDDHGAEIDLDQLKTDVHGLAQEVESVENDLHLDKDSVPIAETVATTEKNAEATLIFDKRDVDVEDLTENKLDGNESDVMSDLNEIENNIGDSGNENSIADEVKDSFKMKVEDILEIPVGESTGTAVGDDIPTTTTEESDVIDEEKEADEGSTEERLSEKEKRMSVILHQYAVKVLELIYWRDVKKTGVVFGSMMFVLVSLACCTLLSVLAYLSLAVLTVTFSFRVYKNVMQAVQKTNDGHPFKKLLETDIELREEVISCAAENIAKHVNSCHLELRRLYLVVDYIDSIKFGMLLWLLTYIGSWFNGITLVMLAVVSIFTLPKVYETYKVPIDSQVNMVRGHLNKVMTQITAKIPFPKKKPKTQ